MPGTVIIFNQKINEIPIIECLKLGIPTVSRLDTNCDPNLVDIPIPANDDAVRSIKLILSTLSDAIISGQRSLK